MGEDVDGEFADVLGQHVLPSPQQGLRPGGRDQAQGGPRAGPVRQQRCDLRQPEPARVAGGEDQPHHVLGQRVVDEDPLGVELEVPQPLRRRAPAVGVGRSVLIR